MSAAGGPVPRSAVLTHHWLVRRRGGEQVLAALCELLPGAPIYTLVHDPAGVGPGWPEVHTSWLQRVPGAARLYPKLLPLMPAAARAVRLPPVDLVVCSDAAIAKGMTADPASEVVCYCHSPMRYAWDLAQEYGRTLPALLRPLWRRLAARLREKDHAAAQRVDRFVANSRHVADRIRRNYGRDSVVVHPPVDLPPEPVTGPRGEHYLALGHHVPYKRLDLAAAACAKLGRRLTVVGDGPDVRKLRRNPPPGVELLGWQPHEAIAGHMARARALLFPGEEDFGIVPVEAMAHGCPVVAYGVGGACETVAAGVTGVLFGEQTVEALCEAMLAGERTTFDPAAMHAHAQQFGKVRFLREMGELLSHRGASGPKGMIT